AALAGMPAATAAETGGEDGSGMGLLRFGSRTRWRGRAFWQTVREADKRKRRLLAEPAFRISSRKRSDVFGRPGGDLLSQALRLSTIGAKGFNGRVRDGIGFWVPCNYHQIGEKHLSEFWLILFLTRRAHASHASSLVSDRLNHAA